MAVYVTVLILFSPSILNSNAISVDSSQWKVEIAAPSFENDLQSLPSKYTHKVRAGEPWIFSLAASDLVVPRKKYKVTYYNLDSANDTFSEQWIVPSIQPIRKKLLSLEPNTLTYNLGLTAINVIDVISTSQLPDYIYANGTITFQSAPPQTLLTVNYLSHLTRKDLVYRPNQQHVKTYDYSAYVGDYSIDLVF